MFFDGSQRSRDGQQRSYSAKEVARHTRPDDCWLIVKGKVYDVSGWGASHPGGVVIYTHGGKARALLRPPARTPPAHARCVQDATDVFSAFHATSTWQLLRARQIGTCDDATSDLLLDFRRLRADMQAARLFESNKLYYVFKVRTRACAWLCVALDFCSRSPRRASRSSARATWPSARCRCLCCAPPPATPRC
jgi:hypothetical protein